MADDLPEVWADPDKLTQVLTNLVENAIRHGSDPVTVSAYRADPAGDLVTLVAPIIVAWVIIRHFGRTPDEAAPRHRAARGLAPSPAVPPSRRQPGTPRASGGREELAAELSRRRAEDLGRAYTSYGPQLDEVELRLEGRALRRFGSQGQQRLVLLAMLFAERSALMEAGRDAPLMLLDDVMSELDPAHRELLVSLLGSGGQAVITATEAAHVPAADAARIEVTGGVATAPPTLSVRSSAQEKPRTIGGRMRQ